MDKKPREVATITTTEKNKAMAGLIDFHSHILYGVDDGAKDKGMTIEMLKMAEKSGTKHIVATPHFVRDRFQVQREEINARVEEVRALARAEGLKIKIYSGQEVYFSNKILEYFEGSEIGTIENTRYMLCELPMSGFDTYKVLDGFYELKLKGIEIILAHPERYKTFIKEPSLINDFIDEGFLFQLNGGSLTGDFGSEPRKTAELFVKHRIYSALGSDGHRSQGRNTDLRQAVEILKNMDKEYFDIMEATMERILHDEIVTFQGKTIGKKKSIFEKIFKR